MKLLLLPIYLVDKLLRGFNTLLAFLRIKLPVGKFVLFCVRILCWIVHLPYFRLWVFGNKYVPYKGGVIIAVNHQSYLDPTLVGMAMLRHLTFVSKKENFDLPIVGPLIDLGGAYPIDRAAGGAAVLGFFNNLLKEGRAVAVFPEGTIPGEEQLERSDVEAATGLLKGKTGVIRMALKAHVPIVPLGISGSGKALCPEAVPKGLETPLPRPTKITLRFGQPIDLSHLYETPITRDILRSETDKLMGIISALVDPSMNYIPHSVPVQPAEYQKMRDFEAARNRAHPPEMINN